MIEVLVFFRGKNRKKYSTENKELKNNVYLHNKIMETR